ncbi:MAG TPA: CCA tRNA nucleotidyltransferase [Candidatus Peribacteraceae bacterium]|nr:CCA tRNA nucleotidyltransferase [Candidatus Peribacteraceae bacterium]
MPVAKDIIDRTLATPYGENAYKIVEMLTDKGFDAWWVGGAARDMLQGKIPTDIDIATSATPRDILAVFPKATVTPKALGSTRVPMKSDVFEVTTFREDDEKSDGRFPEAVVFSTREKDAARRDFTVNAMYFHPISRAFYDPFDGEADLREKLIRFIGDPAIRIKHDALRLLRAVRFRAQIDGQYHPDTYRALGEQAALVETLSGTRQLEELEKMLLTEHPSLALEDLWELHILEHFIPELHACKGVPQPAQYHHEGDVWNHLMSCLQAFRAEDGIDVRIAALFHDIGKVETFSLEERIRFDHHATMSSEITTGVLTRLQMPKKRIEKIAWLIKHHMMMGSFFDMPDERKTHWYYHPWFPELLQLFYLDAAGTTPTDLSLYEKIIDDYQHFLDKHPRPEKPLLSGNDIMAIRGVGSGEDVGKMIARLQVEQINGKVTTKKEAEEFIKSLTLEN